MASFVMFLILAGVPRATGAPVNSEEIQAAQKKWADSIISITAKQQGESSDEVKALATQFVDKLYAYTVSASPVLLKVPAYGDSHASFCLTRECAISHIIDQSATQSWTGARFENAGLVLQEDAAMAMGSCFFTGSDAVEMRFEYSFGYVRDSAGKLRISLLHMSPANVHEGAAVNTPAHTEKVVDGEAASTIVSPKTNEERTHLLPGHDTKVSSEATGGSIFSSLVKILVILLLLFTLAVTALTAQVKSRPGMTQSDKIAAGFGIFQRKVQGVTTGRNTILPSGYDKSV